MDHAVGNLHAFARLYGYVKYFHPSDEAATTNWNTFAIDGARRVVSAPSDTPLVEILLNVFQPIAPTVQIYTQNDKPPPLSEMPRGGAELVAWQHLGDGIDSPGFTYRSIRTPVVSPDQSTRLFPQIPNPSEVATVDLGGGLWARVPLVLPHLDPTGSNTRRDRHASLHTRETRIAAVIVAWNALQHFWPYFDVVTIDWNAELDRALVGALNSTDELRVVLEKMLEPLRDGHAAINCPDDAWDGVFPIAVDWIENQLVITASDCKELAAGDIVESIDGQPAKQWILARAALISGSSQWKYRRAAQKLLYGEISSAVVFSVRGEDGRQREATLTRGTTRRHERSEEPVRALEDGIFYVDLDRASWSQIEQSLDTLAVSSGVVFDLRGYPDKSGRRVLRHLLTKVDDHQWMFVPQIVRPDRRQLTWLSGSWNLTPAEPQIRGPVVFLTDSRAISYAESVLGYVDGYGIGPIVGTPTAGANGNAVSMELPGGFKMTWTGMKVLQHDGSQLHAVGIAPTHSVTPTLAGVRAGRDELLEKSMALLPTPSLQ